MSESDSAARRAPTTRSKKPRGSSKFERSDARPFELASSRDSILEPSATSTLTRSDTPNGPRQSPISAQSVSLVARQLSPSFSIAETQASPEQTKENQALRLRKEQLKKMNRVRAARYRASRAARNASEVEAPPLKSVTEAPSDWNGSRAKWAREMTASELEKQGRNDGMSALGPDEHDPSKDFEWFEKVGDNAGDFGSDLDCFASESGL